MIATSQPSGRCQYTGHGFCVYWAINSGTTAYRSCWDCHHFSEYQSRQYTQLAPKPVKEKPKPKNQQLRDQLKKLPHNRKKMRF